MATTEVNGEASATSAPDHTLLVARFATLFLLAPEELDQTEIRDKLVEALREDARVSAVAEPEPLAPDERDGHRVFLHRDDADPQSMITGADARNCVVFPQPIEFEVHVPRKNQPTQFSLDEPASEDYVAVWDGSTLIVGWRQKDASVSSTGGQIVAQILDDAAQGVGYEVYSQACDPACRHVFAHVNMFIDAAPDVETSTFTAEGWNGVRVRTTKMQDDASSVGLLYWDISAAVDLFSGVKNVGRRVLDLEAAARSDLIGLMRLQYLRAHVYEHGYRDRPKMLWDIRDWRSRARVHVARLWLLLASIEESRREWSELKHQLEKQLDDRGMTSLFQRDLPVDVATIEALNTVPIQGALQESSDSLDSTALTRATSAIAVSAVIGVVVGHFL